jgi:precorrin-3B C17-methyltransferase
MRWSYQDRANLAKIRAAVTEDRTPLDGKIYARTWRETETIVPLAVKIGGSYALFSSISFPAKAGAHECAGEVADCRPWPWWRGVDHARSLAPYRECNRSCWLRAYLERLPPKGQTRHQSGNRVEMERARHALRLVEDGRHVALVSGGDPGVFAMAAAVFEAIEDGEPDWRDIDVAVSPGVSALQAAAARIGAPLGHDFCAISLSDNRKPWSLVENRLAAAATADFVIALYNPASTARPGRIHDAFALLRGLKAASTPVVFARAVGQNDEHIDRDTCQRGLGPRGYEHADHRRLSETRVFRVGAAFRHTRGEAAR